MPITLPLFEDTPATTTENHAERIEDIIEVGTDLIKAYEKSKFFKDMRVKKAYADILRQCHVTLGAGGNFKRGCLYRQKEIEGAPRGTTCDHAVPITYLRDWVMQGESSFYDLAFAPVVLITHEADKDITSNGFAKRMPHDDFQKIMGRYLACGIEIITHHGVPVDEKWDWGKHIELVLATEELKPTIEYFKNKNIELFSRLPYAKQRT